MRKLQSENLKLLSDLRKEETIDVDVNLLLRFSDLLPLKNLEDLDKYDASLRGSKAEEAKLVSYKMPDKLCIIHFYLSIMNFFSFSC